jgi:hypothetical protein
MLQAGKVDRKGGSSHVSKACWKVFVSVVLIGMVGLPAMAQPAFAPPQIPYGVSISTESAKNVAATSIAEAQKNNWKMAIAIVDTGGYLVYFERM